MSINTIVIICFILALLLTLLFVAFKKLEKVVCSEVCAIFCNTIVYIDQLCGVNNDILSSWRKFCLKSSISGEKSFSAEKKMTEEIIFRKKEIEQLGNHHVHLSFQPSFIKTLILHKHKLSNQEVQAALMTAESTEIELKQNFDFLVDLLRIEKTIPSGWAFAENRLKCFQHEANAMFYGALEGLCSFPKDSLTLYEQQRTRLKNLPSEIGLNKRKEDYLQLQEIEFNKAEELLKTTGELMDNDNIQVDLFGNQLFTQQVNIFFAGSKELQTERDIFSNVISQLQTKWKDKNINLYGYSFQNFEHGFIYDGHQCTYNEFINRYADITIFVLNGNVGGKTKEEFDIAMDSFKKQGHPIIYVYSRISDLQNEDVESTRNRVNEESQYWQDYSDNEQLRLLIKNDLSERLQNSYEILIETRRKTLE